MKRFAKIWLLITGGGAVVAMAALQFVKLDNNTYRIILPGSVGPETGIVSFASVPPAPVLSDETASSLVLGLSPGDNPAGTEYAVKELESGKWVDPKERTVVSDRPVWASDKVAWNGSSGITLSGLAPEKAYVFAVKARNSLFEETVLGPAAVAATVEHEASGEGTETPAPGNAPPAAANVNASSGSTGKTVSNSNRNANAPANANAPYVAGIVTPGRPAVIRLSPYGARIIVDAGGNTVATFFAIEETISRRYLQKDGSLGAQKTYDTVFGWGGDSGIVIKTRPNTAYAFRVLAKPGR